MFSRKCLDVHGVHGFEYKKDEDNCLVRHNQLRVSKIKLKQHFNDVKETT